MTFAVALARAAAAERRAWATGWAGQLCRRRGRRFEQHAGQVLLHVQVT
jgi:hypothetical protein